MRNGKYYCEHYNISKILKMYQPSLENIKDNKMKYSLQVYNNEPSRDYVHHLSRVYEFSHLRKFFNTACANLKSSDRPETVMEAKKALDAFFAAKACENEPIF